MTKYWYPHVTFNPNNPYCYYHIWQCFFIAFFFLDDLEKKKRRLQKIYGQNELKSKTEMMSHRALFDKKRLKAAPTDNTFCHMIFAGNLGTGKTMAARCMAGNNNSIYTTCFLVFICLKGKMLRGVSEFVFLISY